MEILNVKKSLVSFHLAVGGDSFLNIPLGSDLHSVVHPLAQLAMKWINLSYNMA